MLQKAMRRLRLTTEDLFEQLRQKGVFYLEGRGLGHCGEQTGCSSVIRRPEEEPVTPKAGAVPSSQGLEVVVISDGSCPCAPWGAVRKGPGLGAPPVYKSGAWGRSRYS